MNYSELMNKSDKCCLKAIYYAKHHEHKLAKFYKSASIGYKIKALKLNIKNLFNK